MKKGVSGGKKAAPKRKRKSVNLTLSEFARKKGEMVAAENGLKFSQFVDFLLRQEFRARGLLPPEGE